MKKENSDQSLSLQKLSIRQLDQAHHVAWKGFPRSLISSFIFSLSYQLQKCPITINFYLSICFSIAHYIPVPASHFLSLSLSLSFSLPLTLFLSPSLFLLFHLYNYIFSIPFFPSSRFIDTYFWVVISVTFSLVPISSYITVPPFIQTQRITHTILHTLLLLGLYLQSMCRTCSRPKGEDMREGFQNSDISARQ